MRNVLTLTLVSIAIGLIGTGDASAACNIRGEFCGYPPWAANAFSDPRDRVPNRVLRDIERRDHYQQYRRYNHHRDRRYQRRYRDRYDD